MSMRTEGLDSRTRMFHKCGQGLLAWHSKRVLIGEGNKRKEEWRSYIVCPNCDTVMAVFPDSEAFFY